MRHYPSKKCSIRDARAEEFRPIAFASRAASERCEQPVNLGQIGFLAFEVGCRSFQATDRLGAERDDRERVGKEGELRCYRRPRNNTRRTQRPLNGGFLASWKLMRLLFPQLFPRCFHIFLQPPSRSVRTLVAARSHCNMR